MKRNKSLVIPVALIILLTLTSWGKSGHSIISFRINLSFNYEMSFFNDWVFYLSEHASDADERKKYDSNEAPRHYIDIDNYPDFIADGSINQSLDSCINAYGEDFVAGNGFLPWATAAMYDSVVNCLKREDWANAKKYAADLGHYVADGHMPMHLTRNYDGQFSGNKGIHARYEITLINKISDQIIYEGTPASIIEDVEGYVFNYIYRNYSYVDSILIADDYAAEMANGNTSDLYYNALWDRTENITNELFSRASNAIAELLYTAWKEAGKPGSSTTGEINDDATGLSLQLFPNPVRDHLNVSFKSPDQSPFNATIFNAKGQPEKYFNDHEITPGPQNFRWSTESLGNGTYLFVVRTENNWSSKIFMVAR
ncbi:MAG: T9SS type A sorting domain-containing protein [Bacteroidales bacterium]|nr:T9SS type A sorting domain-containing protein [Bacteroidales bacterium]